VPEGRRLFADMTVIDNLRLGAYTLADTAEEDRQLERMLTLFPRLAERREQLARTMSGGEQQMLAIGRALMSEPKFLLLDEPSLGLSPLIVQTMFAMIERIHKDGVAVLLVEQNVALALGLASRAYVLEEGAIVACDTPDALRQQPHIRRAYLGLIDG
jgi:branched-chain amino acid transport system ATP-binding protein